MTIEISLRNFDEIYWLRTFLIKNNLLHEQIDANTINVMLPDWECDKLTDFCDENNFAWRLI